MQCNTMTPQQRCAKPAGRVQDFTSIRTEHCHPHCTCFPRPWLYSGADGSPKMRAGRSDHLRTEICSVGELT